MHDVIGGVVLAEIAITELRRGGVAAVVGHHDKGGRQHLARHDVTAEAYQTNEGVSVDDHACHHVGQEVPS